jgi:hypothetical protein
MPEIDAQMVLKLHRMSGEPVVHCNYLLTQTNGDYELALKILERVLQQRKAQNEQEQISGETTSVSLAEASSESEPDAGMSLQGTAIGDLEKRVHRLEAGFVQLADTLDLINEKLTILLDKISEAGPT